jgi:hypothetical protein
MRLVRSPIGAAAREHSLPVDNSEGAPCLHSLHPTEPRLKQVKKTSYLVSLLEPPSIDRFGRTILLVRPVDLSSFDNVKESNELVGRGTLTSALCDRRFNVLVPLV